ncbi:alpha-2-macroglobulin family protein [Jannaschia seohaensis]|uniref:Apple domain-containing protein n=1 Tax=Jannaschia seohaensis TaxID=475081 RepID=A0A2Y9B448_9RHOB|nr:alpha-2-macroglobulin family protein [Jannaschia seohaensis]PWJ11770.1 hypothetical protein BCF38_11837 [Jannaschia seohaensis]SSA51286.1 hypothetical protein SAMN05421539_11837 [Jannaschia seohaensis]
MNYLVRFALFTLSLTSAAFAQGDVPDDPLPERRLTVSRDTDFPGGDFQSLFDVSYDSCRAACLADLQCRALTYNHLANACFLKSVAAAPSPFVGASSAKVFIADPALVTLAGQRAEDLLFLGGDTLDAARGFARDIGEDFGTGGWTLEELVAAAGRARGANDHESAVLYTGAALTISDESALWTEFARLKLTGSDHGRDDVRDAISAAAAGYLRARSPGERVGSLLVLSEALEKIGRGRDMIPVLRLAQSIEARQDVGDALDVALGKYGFRLVDTQVDSDLASPRICATFSEDLRPGGMDYAPFVTIDRSGDPVVTSEGRQICVEGLEHGRRYSVAFRPGLAAASGETLIKPVKVVLYVRDRSPQLSFPGRGYILPATGQVAVPIVGVNAPEADLKLLRISDRNLVGAIRNDYFGRPLSAWQLSNFAKDLTEEVWTGSATLATALNRDVTTSLPLGEVVEGLTPGVYVLQASLPGEEPDWDTAAAMQWFVVSDIGLATYSGNDGLHVFARSLATAAPAAGVRVELVSRSNAILASAVSDAEGHVRFDPGLARGTGGFAPALVTAALGDDQSFLPLTDPEFDLSDRGVEGNPAAGPVDVFVATDRGVYRAGETIHVTVLARDGRAEALSGFPMSAVLVRPDGVEYSRTLAQSENAGGYVFALPVAGSAPRGTWRLDLFSDPEAPALASQRLLVEDFLPERIDFDLALPEGAIHTTDRPDLTIVARYLFGAPGADLAIEGEVKLSDVRTLEAFPGFVFGRHDRPVSQAFASIRTGARTDRDGRAVVPLTLPVLAEATGPLEAEVFVRLSEGSGRPVERSIKRAVTPDAPVIGIRSMFDGTLAENGSAGFRLIGLGPDLAPAPMNVRWVVNRVETRYQWYQIDGNWNWEPTTTRSRVAEGEAALSGGPAEFSVPVTWGEYELRVETVDGAYATSSVGFSAGWFASASAVDSPDTLELSLDATEYQPGDTARLRIVPRFEGKALITVLSDRLIAMKAVEVSEGENLIDLHVTDAWGAGAYVTASVIRPMDAPSGRQPARALGLAYAGVDPGAHRLAVAVEAAAVAEPRGPLPVAVKVKGVEPGEIAWVTIAAVDEGILGLTGFETPDPSAHYFGQRRLGVALRDVYGRLIDGSSGTAGQVRSGGDGIAQLSMESPPPTEELVASFSGPLTVGADGYARTAFDLPSFNGTVRLMAIAWSPTGVGQAETRVLVRDPVVVTASAPRFLAPGDTSRLLLDFAHTTGPTGANALEVTATGLTVGTVPEIVELAEQGRARVSVPLIAGPTGPATVEVMLRTPDGKALTKTLRIPVEANEPEVARTSRFTLEPGASFVLDAQVFAGLVSGTGTATLAIGPLAYLDGPGLLHALDTYPYGCTEQITSGAMPLLYLDEVAVAMGLVERDRLRDRVGQAITAVLQNQSSNGSFGLWYPSSGDFWLDAYVTDFLSRARAQGFEVPDSAFRAAIDNLRNQVAYAPDFDSGGADLAYALLVLAREGAAVIGDLRYYADQKAGAFSSPLALAQLGAALAAYGDPTRAEAMFARAARAVARDTAEQVGWRDDYGTHLRDAAGVLTLAAEAGSAAVDRDLLAAQVASPRETALSTQEMVWSLLAAHALIGASGSDSVTRDGQPLATPVVRIAADDISTPQTIANGSAQETTLTLTTYGIPETPEPAGGEGYRIERAYYTLDGTPVSPDGVAVGTRLVTVLTVSPVVEGGARLMVDDPLPAGFEIDNPNLLRAGDIGAFDWLDTVGTDSSAFLDDRFLAAVNTRSTDAFQLAYMVRAVSPGTFHQPAASVVDMYRPRFRARTDSGTVTVTE